LYTKATPGIFPFHGPVDTGNLASAAFQATGKLDHHLSFFVKGIKVCRTGKNAESFFAGVADFLIKGDMGFLVVLKGIKGKFFRNLHSATSQQSDPEMLIDRIFKSEILISKSETNPNF
jgi:hypothetical protein